MRRLDSTDVLLTLLRRIRLDAQLRQQDLADHLGVPQSFVSKYESGERRLDVMELRQICARCGLSLQDFVDRLEEALSESQDRQG